MKKKKIIAVSGSIREVSSNNAVLKAIGKLIPENIHYEIYKGIDQLPYFNPDDDQEQSVEANSVEEFREKLQSADAVIICTPEYAYGVPGVLKNALDWIVSSGEFTDKITALISASPLSSGGDKAHASLMLTLGVMGAKITDDTSLIIPVVKKKVNDAGEITDTEFEMQLKKVVSALIN